MTIIEGMSNADYHAADGISKSGLDLIARSPAHFRYAAPCQSSRAMEIGTAIHTAILEPERFAVEYMLLRDVDDRRASAYKEAAKVHGGERTLTMSESDAVAGMQESVWSNPSAASFLRDQACRKELSIFTNDPITGVKVKCRFDALNGLRALDLKKTQDARPSEFVRSVWAYRYHVQEAFYRDVFEWETGDTLDAFGFLAVEQDAPNANKIHLLPDDFVAYGRRLYRQALNTYAQCLDSGHWPSIDGGAEVLSLLPWMMAQIENELDDEGITYGEEA